MAMLDKVKLALRITHTKLDDDIKDNISARAWQRWIRTRRTSI